MKELKYFVIHCSATPEGRDVQPATVKKWHTDKPPAGRGWSKIGYSDIITLDGVTHNMNKYNDNAFVDVNEITNGVAGINSIARHICYIGGTEAKNPNIAKDTRTDAQKEALKTKCFEMVKKHPNILIAGHNQFAPKACPSYDVPKWLAEIGISEKNIYKPS